MVLQTILIYVTLIILLYLASKLAEQSNNFIYIVGAIILYATIFGLRSGVGVDFWGYKEWFDYSAAGFGAYKNMEPGFNLLINICVKVGLPFSFFLGLIAFGQLLLIYLAIKPYKSVYSMLALTFMLGCVWLTYANGLRQQIAFCIFAYSLHFIFQKSWSKYYLSVLVACTFHTSALLLVIFYPLFSIRQEWFKHRSIQFILLASALILSSRSFVTNLIEPIEQFANVLGYGHYFDMDDSQWSREINIGLGFFINLILAICLIYNSASVKKYYNNSFVNNIYDLFFVGILWQYVFIDSMLLGRINYYMLGFQYIWGAFSLAALSKVNRNQYYIILGLYILVFIATLYRMNENTALFMFNWQ